MTQPYIPNDEEESDAASDLGDVADADLVAAAEAAMRGGEPDAQKEGEKTRDEQGRFVKEAPKAASEKPKEAAKEKPSSVIARELAKREAARQDESQYKAKIAEANQLHAQVQQLHAQVQAERAALAKEKEELTRARRDPAGFFASQGWNAEQAIDLATRAKDPVYQETVALREELAKRDSVLHELRQTVHALKAKADGYDKQTEEAKSAHEMQSFWAAIPEDSPVWQDYEEKDDIVYFAQKVRQRYFDKTGKVASPQEVAQYLHYKALQKRAPSAQTAAQKPNAGKPKAKVPRALGSNDTVERRPSNGAKHIHDMTPDEERQYLMEVATASVTGASD
jgi:hypothetical protein